MILVIESTENEPDVTSLCEIKQWSKASKCTIQAHLEVIMRDN